MASRCILQVWLCFAITLSVAIPLPALPSAGCKAPTAATERFLDGGRFVKRHIEVGDFEQVQRTYWVERSSKHLAGDSVHTPFPLLISFHGQTGEARDFGASHNFTDLEDVLAVFPQGMNDSTVGQEQGTGWNVGSGGEAGNATCVPEGVGDSGGCYKSCQKLQQCGRCNWSTCYDDVLFVQHMIKAVAREFCIDLRRVYLHGESNGAEMVQHLIREIPGAFAGFVPWFGTPLLGFLLGPRGQIIRNRAKLAETAFLSLHGRQDTTIPPNGGVTDAGWIFEPEAQVSNVFAANHGCKSIPTPIVTRWDGGPLDFRCTEHTACTSKRRVMQCLYDGVHGDWPTGTAGDEITLWFLLQSARSSFDLTLDRESPSDWITV